MTTRSPSGSRRVMSAHSGRSSPSAKNGPTVCPGVATSFSAMSGHFERCGVATAQHHVEGIAERPFGLAQIWVVGGDQPLARRGVGGALIDRVVLQERVAGEIHLGDESR